MINFEVCEKDENLIMQIADRAISLLDELEKNILYMDLCALRNSAGLDIERLFQLDDENFIHDIIGISQNINRNTGALENLFAPRCMSGAA